jgi:periplasmic protein CpxP/Spy
MTQATKRAGKAVVTTLSGLILAMSGSLLAGSTASAQELTRGRLVAQASPTSAPAAQSAQMSAEPLGAPGDRVELRILELHNSFHITPAQEPLFRAYADTIRANAAAMDALFQERAHNPDRSAVTELHWYARLTGAHAEAVNRLIPSFEALYQSLSDQQRRAADTVFEQLRQRRMPHRAG